MDAIPTSRQRSKCLWFPPPAGAIGTGQGERIRQQDDVITAAAVTHQRPAFPHFSPPSGCCRECHQLCNSHLTSTKQVPMLSSPSKNTQHWPGRENKAAQLCNHCGFSLTSKP